MYSLSENEVLTYSSLQCFTLFNKIIIIFKYIYVNVYLRKDSVKLLSENKKIFFSTVILH